MQYTVASRQLCITLFLFFDFLHVAESWIVTAVQSTATSLQTQVVIPESHVNLSTRRRLFISIGSVIAPLAIAGVMPELARAAENEQFGSISTSPYRKQADKFGYEFQPPPNFEPGNKLLKTHLDEVNFENSQISGYQFGITVDPVRISSLRQFGSPEEVAAKVVMAEVNRDGVFEVTLMEDPMAAPDDSFYLLNYLSKGKRGDKRFLTKFFIQGQMLYALTAQCKEQDYPNLQQDMVQAIDTFRTL